MSFFIFFHFSLLSFFRHMTQFKVCCEPVDWLYSWFPNFWYLAHWSVFSCDPAMDQPHLTLIICQSVGSSVSSFAYWSCEIFENFQKLKYIGFVNTNMASCHFSFNGFEPIINWYCLPPKTITRESGKTINLSVKYRG